MQRHKPQVPFWGVSWPQTQNFDVLFPELSLLSYDNALHHAGNYLTYWCHISLFIIIQDNIDQIQ